MDELHNHEASRTGNSEPFSPPHSRSRQAMRIAAAMLGLLALAVGGYSLYVAVHQPDPQETVLLGQDRLAANSPAGLRILVRNGLSGKPVQGAEITLALRTSNAAFPLGTFHTDADGSLTNSIAVPDVPPGPYDLLIETKSSIGRDRLVRKVQIQHPARILLGSDKPLYQPGQTIHLRTLILNGRTQKPYADEAVTFEIKDPKGNKVFKETGRSSAFGIASTDFPLATELNLGRYEIRAISGPATAERTIEVKRYVLPKFKARITTSRPYYLPGETVAGLVQATYFFGRPVGGAVVKFTAATFQEKPVAITETNGVTDASGLYNFQFALPDFLVGLPQNAERAFLDLTAEITDTTGHSQETTLSLSVARNELELTAIPEAGAVVPGVENVLYVLATYPDGRPASCKIFFNGTAYQTDPQGVSEVRLSPADLRRAIELQAIDSSGRKAKLTYVADSDRPSPAFLLQTDKAVYRVGESAKLRVISPEEKNTVFIDVIKEGQTVLTRSVGLQKHNAAYSLAMSASLAGTLSINAYVITAGGEDRGCSRIIYVQPASGLNIAATTDKSVYRPGEVARLDFAVTDAAGKPTPTALGIAAVDESVFALSESHPGLLQQFLEVESDLLKPRYQIKSFEFPGQFLSTAREVQSLGKAYFAGLERRPSGPSVDELVRLGSLTASVVEHARQMRGTPAFQQARNDPQFAGIVRLLENEAGTYNLRDATGPAKQQSVQNHRRAYFRQLGHYSLTGVAALLIFWPVYLLVRHSWTWAKTANEPQSLELGSRYEATANSCSKLIALLTLFPLIWYPIGLFIFAWMRDISAGWFFAFLAASEAVVFLGAARIQFRRLRSPANADLEPDMVSLRSFLSGFLLLYACSRVGMICLAADFEAFEGLAVLIVAGSLIAPLLLLGGLNSHIRERLLARGITPKVVHLTLLDVAVVLVVLALLGGMLLPSLAKAKAKAQRINFVNDLRQIEIAKQLALQDGVGVGTEDTQAPRVRRDFPETLFWRPELITDDRGKATLEIPLADSITTWRASIDAISSAGNMGSVEMPITVFQDFFVDLDLPVSMSLGDQLTLPVACYNYLKEAQDIRLSLPEAPWFETPSHTLSVHLEAGETRSVGLPLTVLQAGNHSLRVTARGTKTSDAIEREIRVVPTGERVEHSQSGILGAEWTDMFFIPPGAIGNSESLWARFYPSRFSEVVEGMDSILQAPFGCFEQTSSTTYPNVLVLDYLKRMGRLNPEIEIKARKLINTGYQRLLTFEVAGGGFEWFGRPPANICLTAYGVLEFTDMARVHPVDEAVTDRARQWLFGQQNSDGSWDEIHRGWTWEGRGSMTAFVAWALAESGDRSAALDRSLAYLRSRPADLSNLYAKALAANAFLARNHDDVFGHQLAEQLHQAALHCDDKALHWRSDGYSVTFSHDAGMDLECTALSLMALMKDGRWPQSVKQSLAWISKQKTAEGGWGSTQATILAIRALLAGSAASLGQDFSSTLTVFVNDHPVQSISLSQTNSDVMRSLDLTPHLRAGQNSIAFRQVPGGELPFQLTGSYWLRADRSRPASSGATPPSPEALRIDLHYDRSTLPVNERLGCTVVVSNNTDQTINIAIVDLGIPPGFEVDTSAFEALQTHGRIAKFEVTGNQVILYLREISEREPTQFIFELRVKYPLRVHIPLSTVYEYYQPKNRAQSASVTLQAVAQSAQAK